MKIQKQIDEVLHEMETNYRDELVDKLAKLQERFETNDGYTMQAKAEEILEGIGFEYPGPSATTQESFPEGEACA